MKGREHIRMARAAILDKKLDKSTEHIVASAVELRATASPNRHKTGAFKLLEMKAEVGGRDSGRLRDLTDRQSGRASDDETAKNV
jgi:hypothetical protein